MYSYAFIAVFVTASAFLGPLVPRVDPCNDNIADTISPVDDGPVNSNVDAPAGIGAEFESPGFGFKDNKCNRDNTFALKGKTVKDRIGTEDPPHWRLTGDTGTDAGTLTAEYITDGKVVKVGTGDAVAAARGIVNDLMQAWNPKNGDQVKIDEANSVCGPWTVFGVGRRTGIPGLSWAPQITTPMPLEALYSLMRENKQNLREDRNVLDGETIRYPDGLNLVTQEYFQSTPNDIVGSTVADDVLAFCTLVLSYAKPAALLRYGQSPKLFTAFMPRTEFNTLFRQVRGRIPGDLFALFKKLACYQTNEALEIT